jgi:hypothetical protein
MHLVLIMEATKLFSEVLTAYYEQIASIGAKDVSFSSVHINQNRGYLR